MSALRPAKPIDSHRPQPCNVKRPMLATTISTPRTMYAQPHALISRITTPWLVTVIVLGRNRAMRPQITLKQPINRTNDPAKTVHPAGRWTTGWFAPTVTVTLDPLVADDDRRKAVRHLCPMSGSACLQMRLCPPARRPQRPSVLRANGQSAPSVREGGTT